MGKTKKISWFSKVFDYKMFFYDIVKWTGALPTLIYMRMKPIYVSKEAKKLRKEPALIASNHTSYLDPIILNTLMLHRRMVCIATKEVFDTKIGPLIKAIRCILVDKENVSVKTFKDAKNMFDRGHYVAIFPQGQIVDQDKTSDYKMGTIMIAYFANVPIIPVYIERKKKWWHRQRVVVGEKIYVNNGDKSKILNIEEMQQLANLIKEKEIELENKVRKEGSR